MLRWCLISTLNRGYCSTTVTVSELLLLPRTSWRKNYSKQARSRYVYNPWLQVDDQALEGPLKSRQKSKEWWICRWKPTMKTTAVQMHAPLVETGHNLLATILRCHSSLGWMFRGSAYCQLIQDVNKTRRLEWAKENLGQKKILFSLMNVRFN